MPKWYICENSSAEKPAEIDKTSSKVYNYIRKDFIEILAKDDEEAPTLDFNFNRWQYKEAKIRKTDWGTFVQSNINYYLADKNYEPDMNQYETFKMEGDA